MSWINQRIAVSLVELIVVLTIIALLLGLLLPAVQSARERARETVCRNNLYQMGVAMGHYFETRKRYPPAGRPAVVGGWSVELLPYLEMRHLYDRVTPGTPITSAPAILLRRPAIMRCPSRNPLFPPSDETMDVSHYVLTGLGVHAATTIFDAPLQLQVAWASGPGMDSSVLKRQRGPHHGGFFDSQGRYFLDGQEVQ